MPFPPKKIETVTLWIYSVIQCKPTAKVAEEARNIAEVKEEALR